MPKQKGISAVSNTGILTCFSLGCIYFVSILMVSVLLQLWSEMRRHEILREELRQRRKQLEALMAEHQRRKELAETISTVAASVKSEGSEAQRTPQQSRTEK